MRAAMFALLIGCSPSTQTITPSHPAHPDAQPGRLAGPPAALRPGVAEVTPPAPATRDEHAGHDMPAPPPAQPEELKPPAEAKPEVKPAAKKPAAKAPAKKPAAKPPAKEPPKPADDPHKGHH